MGLKGKLSSQISIKWDGDLFHLFQFPYQFSEIVPHIIKSVDLLAGSWGTPGSIVIWTYNQDGVTSVAKEIIESVVMEEKKKSITYKVIEGDLMKYFNSFKIGVAVAGVGEDKTVTWTMEYEKRNDAVPEPTTLVDRAMDLCKGVERSRRLVPN